MATKYNKHSKPQGRRRMNELSHHDQYLANSSENIPPLPQSLSKMLFTDSHSNKHLLESCMENLSAVSFPSHQAAIGPMDFDRSIHNGLRDQFQFILGCDPLKSPSQESSAVSLARFVAYALHRDNVGTGDVDKESSHHDEKEGIFLHVSPSQGGINEDLQREMVRRHRMSVKIEDLVLERVDLVPLLVDCVEDVEKLGKEEVEAGVGSYVDYNNVERSRYSAVCSSHDELRLHFKATRTQRHRMHASFGRGQFIDHPTLSESQDIARQHHSRNPRARDLDYNPITRVRRVPRSNHYGGRRVKSGQQPFSMIAREESSVSQTYFLIILILLIHIAICNFHLHLFFNPSYANHHQPLTGFAIIMFVSVIRTNALHNMYPDLYPYIPITESIKQAEQIQPSRTEIISSTTTNHRSMREIEINERLKANIKTEKLAALKLKQENEQLKSTLASKDKSTKVALQKRASELRAVREREMQGRLETKLRVNEESITHRSRLSRNLQSNFDNDWLLNVKDDHIEGGTSNVLTLALARRRDNAGIMSNSNQLRAKEESVSLGTSKFEVETENISRNNHLKTKTKRKLGADENGWLLQIVDDLSEHHANIDAKLTSPLGAKEYPNNGKQISGSQSPSIHIASSIGIAAVTAEAAINRGDGSSSPTPSPHSVLPSSESKKPSPSLKKLFIDKRDGNFTNSATKRRKEKNDEFSKFSEIRDLENLFNSPPFDVDDLHSPLNEVQTDPRKNPLTEISDNCYVTKSRASLNECKLESDQKPSSSPAVAQFDKDTVKENIAHNTKTRNHEKPQSYIPEFNADTVKDFYFSHSGTKKSQHGSEVSTPTAPKNSYTNKNVEKKSNQRKNGSSSRSEHVRSNNTLHNDLRRQIDSRRHITTSEHGVGDTQKVESANTENIGVVSPSSHSPQPSGVSKQHYAFVNKDAAKAPESQSDDILHNDMLHQIDSRRHITTSEHGYGNTQKVESANTENIGVVSPSSHSPQPRGVSKQHYAFVNKDAAKAPESEHAMKTSDIDERIRAMEITLNEIKAKMTHRETENNFTGHATNNVHASPKSTPKVPQNKLYLEKRKNDSYSIGKINSYASKDDGISMFAEIMKMEKLISKNPVEIPEIKSKNPKEDMVSKQNIYQDPSVTQIYLNRLETMRTESDSLTFQRKASTLITSSTDTITGVSSSTESCYFGKKSATNYAPEDSTRIPKHSVFSHPTLNLEFEARTDMPSSTTKTTSISTQSRYFGKVLSSSAHTLDIPYFASVASTHENVQHQKGGTESRVSVSSLEAMTELSAEQSVERFCEKAAEEAVCHLTLHP